MDSVCKERFKQVIEHIFSNWTALQLAVEHGMGGPDSQQTASDMMQYMCDFCLMQSKLESDDIVDALEDIMEEEFDTACEDNSPKEIAQLLMGFLNLLQSGNTEAFEIEFNKLPCSKVPVKKSVPQVRNNGDDSSSDESEDGSSTMEVDPEWTVVKTRRKK